MSARGVPYVMLRSPDRGEALLPAAHPGGVEARPADGRQPHGGPAGRRVRPHHRQARARTRSPGSSPTSPPTACSRSCRSTRSRPLEQVRRSRGRCASARRCSRSRRAAGWCCRRGPARRRRSTGAAAGCCSPARRGARSALVALAGLGAFGWTVGPGTSRVFLTGDSYLARRARPARPQRGRAGLPRTRSRARRQARRRRVPAAGFLVYFGIPSVFVDTTDVWMAGRRARHHHHRGRPGRRAGARRPRR